MVERLLAVEEPANAILAAAYPEPHVHLLQLAVDPAAQGHGLGRTLVRAVVDEATAAERRVCLFTTAAANVPFYRSCGLTEVGSGVAAAGVPWWAFGTERSPVLRP
jgi:ribosomal protein S18 acetylase RimI-like enzyme